MRDMITYADADKVIFIFSDMVATRFRRYGYIGDVVHLYIRYNDLTHEGKQHKIKATNVCDDIYRTASKL